MKLKREREPPTKSLEAIALQDMKSAGGIREGFVKAVEDLTIFLSAAMWDSDFTKNWLRVGGR